MKKLSFASQLFIIVSSILLITSIAFSIITITSATTIASDEVYSRLSSYSLIIDSMEMNERRRPDNDRFDMRFGYIKYNQGTKKVVTNFDFEITDDDILKLIDAVKNNNETNGFRIQGKENINSRELYYVCQARDNFNDYTIVFTDTSYADNIVKSLSIRLIIVFLSMILISILAISLWSNSYAKRLKRLELHIEKMPDKKYEEEYLDGGKDEVGELSESIEKMRLQIYQNENIKQEMLQNLSHDFKTPIAVIKSYAEAIQDGVESTDALNIIIEQSNLLESKVVKLLQYNRIEYLDKNKPFVDIDMDHLINEVILKYKHQSNINFILDIEPVFFKGYYENWDIVFSNIIENALRYAKSEIKFIVRENRVRIYNDGPNIDEKFLNNDFKPYEKGSKGQFGLGMSIVKKTVNFFGYSLKVQNEEPIGVSFIIELLDKPKEN